MYFFISNYYTCSSQSLDQARTSETQTCSLYHDNLLLQKFNDLITQVLK